MCGERDACCRIEEGDWGLGKCCVVCYRWAGRVYVVIFGVMFVHCAKSTKRVIARPAWRL